VGLPDRSLRFYLHKVATTMQTRSGQMMGAPSDKVLCSNCQTPLNQPRKNNIGHGQSSVKIILRVKVSCSVCQPAFDQLLAQTTRGTYWNKEKIQNWAQAAHSIKVRRIVFRQKKYIVQFCKGTTLKLRNGDKVSILRLPNRWIWDNQVTSEWAYMHTYPPFSSTNSHNLDPAN
jgi:hypothetical protein